MALVNPFAGSKLPEESEFEHVDEVDKLDELTTYADVKLKLHADNPVPLGTHTSSEFASSIFKQPLSSSSIR